ncbi:MAG: SAM-dependent methyltransferase [Pseudonocardiales bacterium]|nr:SAM-dependent methyltransferase [Pseudonocardiales bacterium]
MPAAYPRSSTVRGGPASGTPHSARVWDYWLGGKDHYAIDRALGDRILAAIPRQRDHVRANREFLVRAVEFLVGEAGIRQIVDIGAGLPTSPNVHEVAQAVAPETRVVYVDNDPVVMAHARALMTAQEPGRVAFVPGDLSAPHGILDDVAAVLDLDQPVAVLILATLMFVDDAAAPCQKVRELMAPLASGSYLGATHTTADLDPSAMAAHVAAAADLGLRVVPRSRAQVLALFGPELELAPPGLVPVLQWRPRGIVRPRSHAADLYAGVARKP